MEQVAKDIFKAIDVAIQFDAEKRDGVIPFEFLGIVKDYNGVDIKQTKDYIEMSCANYIRRLLKSHGWDKDSSKPLPPEMVSAQASNSSSNTINASDGIATESVYDNNDAVNVQNECTVRSANVQNECTVQSAIQNSPMQFSSS